MEILFYIITFIGFKMILYMQGYFNIVTIYNINVDRLALLITPFIELKYKKTYSLNVSNLKLVTTYIIYLTTSTLLYLYIYRLIFLDSLSLSLALILYMSIFFILFTTLFYLSIHDLKSYDIPADLTNKLLFFVIILNIVIGVVKLIGSLKTFDLVPIDFLSFSPIGTPETLFSMIIGYLMVWLLVRYSNEKYIGSGDADILAILGGFMGLNFLIGIFVTIILSSFIGLIYAVYLGKLKGVIIPMVPFLLIGALISLIYSDIILDILFPVFRNV